MPRHDGYWHCAKQITDGMMWPLVVVSRFHQSNRRHVHYAESLAAAKSAGSVHGDVETAEGGRALWRERDDQDQYAAQSQAQHGGVLTAGAFMMKSPASVKS